MWQVAVYSEHQHDQFPAMRDRFELRKAAGDIAWQLHDEVAIDGGVAAPDTIRMRVDGNSLVIDGRGIGQSIELLNGSSFSPDVPIETVLPVIFRMGEVWIEVRTAKSLESLGLTPLGSVKSETPSASAAGRGPDGDTVAKWLAAAGHLHRMAASSPTFFDAAAQIALDCTGLNAAFVVALHDGQWTVAGSAIQQPEFGISFEYESLELVRRQPDVWRRAPQVTADDSVNPSATLDESIIVAPVSDEAGNVVAAVYGVRHSKSDNRRRGIRALEARVVESIAEAVSVGMARRQQEVNAARQRVLLEHAFSPAVVEYLHRHPEALAPRMREVTLLFADLRDFTSLAERLQPDDACGLIAAVMELLTQAIMNQRGTVVDYYGDGVCAMWNAPLETVHHADLAAAAAMQMLNDLPELSNQWRSQLPTPLKLGIGLHSGVVQVGNAGTRRWIKYGPRGSAVNIASRVQSAAKRLDVALLATDAVRRRLSDRFVTLKVCSAQLPGLTVPLDLFTVFPSTDGSRLQSDLDRYAEALDAFEQGDLDTAEVHLAHLMDTGPATPARFLAQQAAALRQGAAGRRAADELSITPDAVIKILAK